MPENWQHYFSELNGAPASIAVDLELADEAPVAAMPWLLWVKLRFNSPGADGLSSSEELPTLTAIEDALVSRLKVRCNAVYCGRTTARAERIFYFYCESTDEFNDAVNDAFRDFPSYRFRCGEQNDPSWSNYINTLYPSEEQFELIKNGQVLGALMKDGDTLKPEREVRHWIFLACREDRANFRDATERLGYRVEEEYIIQGDNPYAIRLSRTHPVTPEVIDRMVLELFRLAKHYGGDYDGWETGVVKS